MAPTTLDSVLRKTCPRKGGGGAFFCFGNSVLISPPPLRGSAKHPEGRGRGWGLSDAPSIAMTTAVSAPGATVSPASVFSQKHALEWRPPFEISVHRAFLTQEAKR